MVSEEVRKKVEFALQLELDSSFMALSRFYAGAGAHEELQYLQFLVRKVRDCIGAPSQAAELERSMS